MMRRTLIAIALLLAFPVPAQSAIRPARQPVTQWWSHLSDSRPGGHDFRFYTDEAGAYQSGRFVLVGGDLIFNVPGNDAAIPVEIR